MSLSQDTIVDRILELYAERGAEQYGGEAVSQLEHALQAAALAQSERAPEAMVAAALLHDVGHLLDLTEDGRGFHEDDRHETRGAEFLRSSFVGAVVDTVALHVAAKRYLCAVEPSYRRGLSRASMRSLELQGGPLSSDGCKLFRREACWDAAVRVRRWDDLAKVPGRAIPPLASHRTLLIRCLRGANAAG
jgi:phosphonate degradation associated HDIG domain protein